MGRVIHYDIIDRGKGVGKEGKKFYKSPKDAIEEISTNPVLAYRGMSWEEWQKIQRTGFIQSAGQHNFSSQ